MQWNGLRLCEHPLKTTSSLPAQLPTKQPFFPCWAFCVLAASCVDNLALPEVFQVSSLLGGATPPSKQFKDFPSLSSPQKQCKKTAAGEPLQLDGNCFR